LAARHAANPVGDYVVSPLVGRQTLGGGGDGPAALIFCGARPWWAKPTYPQLLANVSGLALKAYLRLPAEVKDIRAAVERARYGKAGAVRHLCCLLDESSPLQYRKQQDAFFTAH